MGENEKRALELPFGHVRFVIKYSAIFVGFLGIAALGKEFSKDIDDARQLLWSTRGGLPLLYIAGMPFYLIYEILWIRRRQDLEKMRSSPMANRVKSPLRRKVDPTSTKRG